MRPTQPSEARDRSHARGESAAACLLRTWQMEGEPDLAALVAEWPILSAHELAELICVDLEARTQRALRQTPESYLSRFPSVAADPELAIDVIYADFLARERLGEQPDVADYQTRFPQFANVLAEQLRLHCAIDGLDGEDPLATATAANADLIAQFESSRGTPQGEISYEILEQIGSGGMGVVYRAYQPALDRFVALKMVRAIDANNEDLLARFRSEARLVASLHHPHIVQVYDYGEHEGLPFLAMELVEGGTLADRLNGTPWPSRAAAVLLSKLAAAVSFAHQRNVIHRDLKPANLLLAATEPEVEVKITDFGLAKFLMQQTRQQTRSSTFLGTPSYMAPEQAGSSTQEVGPGADIYSLGAILYELLTGRPPFPGESAIDTLRLLISSRPASVRSISPHISRDLATICDTCLQSEVNRRYASAAALREDLERYLSGQPIRARAIGTLERTWRWCRRNPVLASAVGLAAGLLVSVAAISLWYSQRLSEELDNTRQAERSERTANQLAQLRLWDAYLTEVTARNVSRQVGQRFAALDTVDKAVSLLDSIGRQDDRIAQLRTAVLSSAALPDIRTVRSVGVLPNLSHTAAVSVAGDRYVIALADGTVRGYRLSNGQQLWTITAPEKIVYPSISANGKYVAIIASRGAIIWNVAENQPRLAWEVPGAKYFTFSPDEKHAAYSLASAGMQLFNLEDGRVLRQLGQGEARSPFAFHQESGRIAVFGPTTVQVISESTGEVECELTGGSVMDRRLAWHPNGEHLAIWAVAATIDLWNVRTRAKVKTFTHRGVPAELQFNSDGSLLVSYTVWDRRLRVWNIATGKYVFEKPNFISLGTEVSDDGRVFFLALVDSMITLMEIRGGACRHLAYALDTPLGPWRYAAISTEGRIVALSSVAGVELWDLQTTRRLAALQIGDCRASFDRFGHLIVGCDQGIFRWPRHSETSADSPATAGASPDPRASLRIRYKAPEKLWGPIAYASLAHSSTGDTLVFEDDDGWGILEVGKASAPMRLQTKHDPRLSALSSRGHVAIANWEDGGATVWNAESGKQLAELGIGRHGIVHFSPDGQTLAATPDGVTIWRTNDWRKVAELHAQGTTPTGLAITFSPDNRVLAVGQPNGILRLVDPRTGNDWARLVSAESYVVADLTFPTDQGLLLTLSNDERLPVQIWDLQRMRQELAKRNLDLPADVLRPNASAEIYSGPLQVVLEDGGLGQKLLPSTPIEATDAATPGSAGFSP